MVCGVMLNQLQQVFLVTSALLGMVSMSAISAAWAETGSTDQRIEEQEAGSSDRRSSLVAGHESLDDSEGRMTSDNRQMTYDEPATTVEEWIAQIEASLVQITGVRVETTESGLQVVLETTEGELSTPATQTIGNALIADIPNAVLALPEGEEFQQASPIEGIALVSVTGLPENRVRVAITGVDAPPTANLSVEASELVLAVTPGTEVAETEEDAIQVVVTGEQDEGYSPSDATTATRTETPLRDIPQSIQIIPQQILEDQQVTQLREATRNVSGVIEGSNFGNSGDAFLIRGFQTNNILLDGIELGTSNLGTNSSFREIANIERVEVLKGPASVLYGTLEPGGIINVVTEQPLPFPFYEVELQAGNFGFLRPSVDLSGSLNADGTALYRLNAVYQTADDFREFDQGIERIFVALCSV